MILQLKSIFHTYFVKNKSNYFHKAYPFIKLSQLPFYLRLTLGCNLSFYGDTVTLIILLSILIFFSLLLFPLRIFYQLQFGEKPQINLKINFWFLTFQKVIFLTSSHLTQIVHFLQQHRQQLQQKIDSEKKQLFKKTFKVFLSFFKATYLHLTIQLSFKNHFHTGICFGILSGLFYSHTQNANKQIIIKPNFTQCVNQITLSGVFSFTPFSLIVLSIRSAFIYILYQARRLFYGNPSHPFIYGKIFGKLQKND